METFRGIPLKFWPYLADLKYVSIYAASKDHSLEDVRTMLGNLVRNFEADATSSRKQIRDILDNDRDLFYITSIGIFKATPDSRGVQYLVALLAANGMLLQALCDPGLDREEALNLGRAARRVDPMVDATLARDLADSAVGSGSVAISDPARVMDILNEIGDPTRIMGSLMRMMRHPNAYLRSKAVKMIGRGTRSVKWVMGRLSEADPRVRANAIESLWGLDTAETRALLNFATNDADNRVVGNALLGLYHMGEATAIAEVIKLASHESPPFRASAGWVMGETADPRFSEALRRMLSDPDASARRRAFAALARLKAANAQQAMGPEWHVAGRMLPGETLKGTRRIMVAVAADDAREQPKVAPLQFLLNEGGQFVTTYKVVEKPEPPAMSVIFVIPRCRETAGGAFFDGAARCLSWKRQSDLWSILPYIETGDGEPPAPHDPDPPFFNSSAEALANTLQSTPKKMDCTDLWTAVWRATKQDANQVRGKRHVILFSSAEEGRIAGHGLITNMQNSRIPLQVICSGPNAQLEEFCKRTHVRFRIGIEEEIPQLIEQAYLNLLSRFEIAYQPVSTDAEEVKVRVQTPSGWGEARIPYLREAD
jgi:HEAT repeat protein